MKLLTFDADTGCRIGADNDKDTIIDLQLAYAEKLTAEGVSRAAEVARALVPEKTNDFLRGGAQSLEAATEGLRYVQENPGTSSALLKKDEVVVGPPVPEPGKIVCVGHNYREHILEMKRELPEYPVLFAKFANTVIGPNEEIPLHSITDKLDYEAEFAIVIGQTAKDVPQEDALEYVAGYTIVNDVTARDLQRRTIQWLQGKAVDGSAPMGPFLVTRDEIPSPERLEICLTVNEEERQRSNSKNLVFNVPHLIEYVSSIMTLEPGDVICTGTPGGVGFSIEPPTFLQDGDVVSITVDKIGTLTNAVKKVEKDRVRQYANEISKRINRIVGLTENMEEDMLYRKPSEKKWSVMQILCHVEEANRFWINDLKQTVHNPERKWGRGMDHPGRLAAVERVSKASLQEIIGKIRQFKATIRSLLLTLDDRDLHIQATHKNPKFGTKPLSFLVGHFFIEHLDTHIAQIERTMKEVEMYGKP